MGYHIGKPMRRRRLSEQELNSDTKDEEDHNSSPGRLYSGKILITLYCCSWSTDDEEVASVWLVGERSSVESEINLFDNNQFIH